MENGHIPQGKNSVGEACGKYVVPSSLEAQQWDS